MNINHINNWRLEFSERAKRKAWGLFINQHTGTRMVQTLDADFSYINGGLHNQLYISLLTPQMWEKQESSDYTWNVI